MLKSLFVNADAAKRILEANGKEEWRQYKKDVPAAAVLKCQRLWKDVNEGCTGSLRKKSVEKRNILLSATCQNEDTGIRVLITTGDQTCFSFWNCLAELANIAATKFRKIPLLRAKCFKHLGAKIWTEHDSEMRANSISPPKLKASQRAMAPKTIQMQPCLRLNLNLMLKCNSSASDVDEVDIFKIS